MLDESEFEETLNKWHTQGGQIFNVNGGNITKDDSFDIIAVVIISFNSTDVVIEIVDLLKKMMHQYDKSSPKIIKNIHSSLKNQEKFFALYLLGKNFKESWDIKSEIEQRIYLSETIRELGISEEQLKRMVRYLFYLMDMEVINGEPVSETIMRIVASEFEENEVEFMIFLRGLLPKGHMN